jgi:hypothetical protein
MKKRFYPGLVLLTIIGSTAVAQQRTDSIKVTLPDSVIISARLKISGFLIFQILLI